MKQSKMVSDVRFWIWSVVILLTLVIESSLSLKKEDCEGRLLSKGLDNYRGYGTINDFVL